MLKILVLVFLVIGLGLGAFISLIIDSFVVTLYLRVPITGVPATVRAKVNNRLNRLTVVFKFKSVLKRLISSTNNNCQVTAALVGGFKQH